MIRRIAAGIIALLMLFSIAGAEEELRGYDAESGYVYVTMGRYPQTADGEVQPVLWRVLAADQGEALLLSEYILFARCMNADLLAYREEIRGDFGRTDLCEYLNSTFMEDAFTPGEAEALVPLEGVGKVYIPSSEELKNKDYGLGVTLKDSGNVKKIMETPGIRAWGTEWAIQNNGYDPAEYPNVKAKIEGSSRKSMPLKELRLFVYSSNRGGHSPYWTRTQSTTDARHAGCIKANGGLGHIEVGRDNEGVRPMVTIRTDEFRITGGSGTKEDPYCLEAVGDFAE